MSAQDSVSVDFAALALAGLVALEEHDPERDDDQDDPTDEHPGKVALNSSGPKSRRNNRKTFSTSRKIPACERDRLLAGPPASGG